MAQRTHFAGFVCVDGFEGIFHKIQMFLRGFTGAFGVTGNHGFHQFTVLFAERIKHARDGVELIQIVRNAVLQQFKQVFHDVQQHQIVRGFDNREVEIGIKRALTMIEPILILVLGILIASIIVSILMGILSVNDLAV